MFAQFRPGLIKELRIDVNLLIGGGSNLMRPLLSNIFRMGLGIHGHSWAKKIKLFKSSKRYFGGVFCILGGGRGHRPISSNPVAV